MFADMFADMFTEDLIGSHAVMSILDSVLANHNILLRVWLGIQIRDSAEISLYRIIFRLLKRHISKFSCLNFY